jgi:hypothetical protein
VVVVGTSLTTTTPISGPADVPIRGDSADALFDALTRRGIATVAAARRKLAAQLAAEGATVEAVEAICEHHERSYPGRPIAAAAASAGVLRERGAWREVAAFIAQASAAYAERESARDAARAAERATGVEPGQAIRDDNMAHIRERERERAAALAAGTPMVCDMTAEQFAAAMGRAQAVVDSMGCGGAAE